MAVGYWIGKNINDYYSVIDRHEILSTYQNHLHFFFVVAIILAIEIGRTEIKIKEAFSFLPKEVVRLIGYLPANNGLILNLRRLNQHAVQREWVNLELADGRTPKGRKIGLTSRAMQESSQIAEPDHAPLMDDMFFDNGAEIPIDRFIAPRVEVELAFVLEKPLRGPRISLIDVLQATAYVTPALEIIDARIEQFESHQPFEPREKWGPSAYRAWIDHNAKLVDEASFHKRNAQHVAAEDSDILSAFAFQL